MESHRVFKVFSSVAGAVLGLLLSFPPSASAALPGTIDSETAIDDPDAGADNFVADTDFLISGDERFLYITSHGTDSLLVYDISIPMSPKPIQSIATGPAGSGPTRLAITSLFSSGEFFELLGVVNRDGGTVAIFDVDDETGMVTPRGLFDPKAGPFTDQNNLVFFGNISTPFGAIAHEGANLVFTFNAANPGQGVVAGVQTPLGPTQVALSTFSIHLSVVCPGANAVVMYTPGTGDGSLTSPIPFSSRTNSIGRQNGVTWLGGREAVLTTETSNAFLIDTADLSMWTFSFPGPANMLRAHSEPFTGVMAIMATDRAWIYDYNANANPAQITFRSEHVLGAPDVGAAAQGATGIGGFTVENNFLFGQSLTVGHVAVNGQDRILTLDLLLEPPPELDSDPSGRMPTKLYHRFGDLLIALTPDSDSLAIFGVNNLEPLLLFRRGEFRVSGADFVSGTRPAITGDGSIGFIADTAGDVLYSFDAQRVGTQTEADALGSIATAANGFGASLSRFPARVGLIEGPVGAGANLVEFFEFSADGQLSPLGSFQGPSSGSINTRTVVTWQPDGQAAHIPIAGENTVYSVDPTQVDAVIDMDSFGSEFPQHAAYAEDSLGRPYLAVQADGMTSSVRLYELNPDGSHASASPFNIPTFTWSNLNTLDLLMPDTMPPRIVIGESLGSLVDSIGDPLNGPPPDLEIIDSDPNMTAPGDLALAREAGRFAITGLEIGEVGVYDVTPAGDLSFRDSVDIFSPIGFDNNVVITKDGQYALIADQDSSFPGVHVIATQQVNEFGGVSLPFELGALQPTTIALSEDERTLLVTITAGSGEDTVQIFGVGKGESPQFLAATLFELVGDTTDGKGEEGDLIALLFNHPMDVVVDQAQEFDRTVVAQNTDSSPVSLGTTYFLSPSVISSNVAFVQLGPGTEGIYAPGDGFIPFGEPGNQGPGPGSTYIDIHSDTNRFGFVSSITGQPAEPANSSRSQGFSEPGVNGGQGIPSGVDLRLPINRGTPTSIDAAGGIVTPGGGSDFLFTEHQLCIFPDSISGPTIITAGPISSTIANLGVASAIQYTADIAPTFDPPAKLVLQYNESDFNFVAGQLEHLVGIFRLEPGLTTPTPITTTLTVDVDLNQVTAHISNLLGDGSVGAEPALNLGGPGGGDGTVGTFATLPVNPVEERSIFMAPGPAGAAAAVIDLPVALGASTAALSGGAAGAYVNHRIEVPGFVEVAGTDPNRIKLTMRTANLFERTSLSGGQSFPAQSGAIFTVETRSAGGSAIPFNSPVNLTVEFIERMSDAETDTVTFAGVRDDPNKMSVVRDMVDGVNVDFDFVGGSASGSVINLTNLSPLTDASGAATYGAVIDPNLTVSLTLQMIVDHILGRSTLGGALFIEADHDSSGNLDAADVVDFIENNP